MTFSPRSGCAAAAPSGFRVRGCRTFTEVTPARPAILEPCPTSLEASRPPSGTTSETLWLRIVEINPAYKGIGCLRLEASSKTILDTTSFRQLSIGKPSFRQPSIGQLFNKVSIHQPCRLVNLLISQPVDSSTELKNTSIRQLTKKIHNVTNFCFSRL